MTMTFGIRLRTVEPQGTSDTRCVKGDAPLCSRCAIWRNKLETGIYSTWGTCAGARERRLSSRMVLGHESKRNGVPSHSLNAWRIERQSRILSNYNRVNGASCTRSAVGGGSGRTGIGGRVLSICLKLGKRLGCCRIYSKHHSRVAVVRWICLRTEEPERGRCSLWIQSDSESRLRRRRSRLES
jgi:hypothetical protein